MLGFFGFGAPEFWLWAVGHLKLGKAPNTPERLKPVQPGRTQYSSGERLQNLFRGVPLNNT